jgi:P pilus assembly chaperone PapD
MNPSKKTLIIIYLIFVVIFAWQSASKKAAPVPAPIRLIASAKSFTLPTTPTLSLINETESPVTVDTCRDISVTANGVQKTNLPEKFCRSVVVNPATTIPLF